MREYALLIAPLARIPVDVESWCRFHLTQKLAIIHSSLIRKLWLRNWVCVSFFFGSFFPHSCCSLLLYLFCYMIRKAHVSGIGEQELHADGFFFFGRLLEVVVLHHGDSLLCVLDILSSDVVAA